MRVQLERNRWPLAISAVALAVSLGNGVQDMRVGNAADPQVTTTQKQTLISLQDAFSSIAEAVEPAVVNIQVEPEVTRRAAAAEPNTPEREFNPFEGLPFGFGEPGNPRSPRQGPSAGSGVIVQRTGNEFFILTNDHVVNDGGRIKVTLGASKREYRATLVGRDPKTDLAVIKIRVPGESSSQRIAEFGDSDKVKVGQWAIAIGNPLDVGQTLTVGVVSAKGRRINDIPGSYADYANMIQTDASINPGNSGGALVDINGNVIGINTAIASPTRGSIGIGFAIPSNVARYVANELIRHGEVVRGYLGVSTFENNWEISPALGEILGVREGAFIEMVSPNTPAARAGLQAEDVVIQWGDTVIRSYPELTQAVGVTPPGAKVPLKVIREGKPITLTVLTEKRPDEETLRSSGGPGNRRERPERREEAPATTSARGLTVRALSSTERQAVGRDGVIIAEVEPGTPVAEAGLIPGTVIHRINETSITSPTQLKDVLTRLGDGEAFIARVSQPGGPNQWVQRTLVVTPEE